MDFKNCLHTKTKIRKDVGYDISCDGEERQHLEICEECGADRMVIEITCSFSGTHKVGELLKGSWDKENFYGK